MKVTTLTKDGVKPVAPLKGEHFWYFTHGQKGRGRWEVQFPLGTKDFPIDANVDPDQDFVLVSLHKVDKQNQARYLLGKGQNDGTFLVLWSLSPGFRGGAKYSLQGNAEVLCLGQEAQGDAGRMGWAPCPVIHVTGPCRLSWTRLGRLYGTPADWCASFDGTNWQVLPQDQQDLLDAMQG